MFNSAPGLQQGRNFFHLGLKAGGNNTENFGLQEGPDEILEIYRVNSNRTVSLSRFMQIICFVTVLRFH